MSSAENATAQETTRFGTAGEVPQMVGAFAACLMITYLGVIFRVVSRRLREYTSEYDTIEINGLDFERRISRRHQGLNISWSTNRNGGLSTINPRGIFARSKLSGVRQVCGYLCGSKAGRANVLILL